MNDPQPAERGQGRANSAVVRSRTNGKACYTCHLRKVRCDILTHGTPCTNCQTHGSSDCRMYIRQTTRRPKSTRTTHDTIRTATNTPSDQSPASTARGTYPTPRDTGRSIATGDASSAPSPEDARQPRRSARHAPSNVEDEPETNHLSEFLSQDDARGREISFTHRLYFIGTEFSTLNHLVRQRSQPSEQGVLHFGSQPHAPRLPEVPADCLRLPGKKLTRELLNAYFTLVNRGFPVIFEEAFMASYDNPDPANPLSLLLLNCILFTGAHVLGATRPEIAKLAPQFYRRARQLFDARYDPAREHYIQAALLFTWYCDRLEDVVSNSWHWVGVATRTAFGLGLHRCADNSNLHPAIKRHWVRLWWTLYQFDVMVSAAHGRVESIDLEQSDVVALEALHFPGVEASPEFAIQHTKICMILSRAMKSVTRLRSTAADRAAATEQGDRELADFYVNLPASLQAFSYETADVWVCVLHLSYNFALLLLHRPSPVPGERERTVEDMRICSDSVTAITAIFESLRKRDLLGSLWIPSAYILFATLVHVCTQLQSPNPIVAASSQRLFSQLMDTLQALTAKWLFARSLLLIFQRGLSQGLGMQLVRPDTNTEVTANDGVDGRNRIVDTTPQHAGGPFEMSNHGSIMNSGVGPRPWWMQDQEHDATQLIAPPLSISLDPGNTTAASAGFIGSAYHPADVSANSKLQLDFELFLAGLGTGDDAAHDFSDL